MDQIAGSEFGDNPSTTVAALARSTEVAQMHSLPPEVLIKIIGLALTIPTDEEVLNLGRNEHENDYYADLYKLASISKHWRAVIHGTASFWYLINSRYPIAVWQKALSQSRFHPLTISFSSSQQPSSDTSSFEDGDKAAVHKFVFIREVFDRIDQWDIVLLKWVKDTPECLVRLGESEAPRLRKLILETEGPEGAVDASYIDIFRGHTPRLQHLELIDTHLNWEGPLLYNLVKLRVSGGGGGAWANHSLVAFEFFGSEYKRV